jgi:LCP family protein required for cell wall assembly
MNKEYFTDNISVETMAELIDETLTLEKNKKKINLLKIIPAVAAVVFVIGLVNLVTFLNIYTPPVYTPPAAGEPEINERKPQGESYTFLILGLDNSGLLTDAIRLVNFNVQENKIAMLSIPRDSYINNSSYRGKINSVLATGFNPSRRSGKTGSEALVDGINFLRQMIKFTFGVPVDYYISMDLTGFRALVDAVGGVDFDVPQDMYYSDPEQNLYINLKKGLQKLDGNKAEQLVRYRKGYPDADLGRIRTQQKFISALGKKMLRFDVAQIGRIFDVMDKYVAHNLTASAITWFPPKLLGVKLEDITLHTVPGEPFRVGKAACYSIYKPETIKLINEHYNPYLTEIPDSNFNIYEGSRIYANQADFSGTTMDKLSGN